MGLGLRLCSFDWWLKIKALKARNRSNGVRASGFGDSDRTKV